MSSARRSIGVSSALAVSLAALVVPSAASAAPLGRAAATDLGPTAAGQALTASLVLKVRSPERLEALVAATQDPLGHAYHRFLSVPEFTARFSPSAADVTSITRYLRRFGIGVTDVYDDRLLVKVSGTAEAFDAAFSVDLHDFTKGGKRFHRPRHAPKIPAALRDLLVAVEGPSSEAHYRPRHVRAPAAALLGASTPALPPAGAVATGVPGSFTVGDVAERYDVNPLYQMGIDGTGSTLGIMTLADFLPADAFAYWNLIGLDVDPDRITQVRVDGGGELGSDAGSGETSLDVEQSGGLAPGAKIVVYDAPNTDEGFIDLFYKAASDNLVDSLSVSWGSAEELYFAAVNGVDATGELLALHQALLESAAQGTTGSTPGPTATRRAPAWARSTSPTWRWRCHGELPVRQRYTPPLRAGEA